jgi:hypothetical protein
MHGSDNKPGDDTVASNDSPRSKTSGANHSRRGFTRRRPREGSSFGALSSFTKEAHQAARELASPPGEETVTPCAWPRDIAAEQQDGPKATSRDNRSPSNPLLSAKRAYACSVCSLFPSPRAKPRETGRAGNRGDLPDALRGGIQEPDAEEEPTPRSM